MLPRNYIIHLFLLLLWLLFEGCDLVPSVKSIVFKNDNDSEQILYIIIFYIIFTCYVNFSEIVLICFTAYY